MSVLVLEALRPARRPRLDQLLILDVENHARDSVDAERGARIDAQMLASEEKRMRECVVTGLDAELEMPAFKTYTDIMLGTVPCAEVNIELVGEGVVGVGVPAMRAKPDG